MLLYYMYTVLASRLSDWWIIIIIIFIVIPGYAQFYCSTNYKAHSYDCCHSHLCSCEYQTIIDSNLVHMGRIGVRCFITCKLWCDRPVCLSGFNSKLVSFTPCKEMKKKIYNNSTMELTQFEFSLNHFKPDIWMPYNCCIYFCTFSRVKYKVKHNEISSIKVLCQFKRQR